MGARGRRGDAGAVKGLGFIAVALVRSALRGLRASPVTTGVAIFTIAAALVLAGGFGLLVTNMGDVLARFGEELQLVAYLEDDLEPDDEIEIGHTHFKLVLPA